jgi:hypothetical protein
MTAQCREEFLGGVVRYPTPGISMISLTIFSEALDEAQLEVVTSFALSEASTLILSFASLF